MSGKRFSYKELIPLMVRTVRQYLQNYLAVLVLFLVNIGNGLLSRSLFGDLMESVHEISDCVNTTTTERCVGTPEDIHSLKLTLYNVSYLSCCLVVPALFITLSTASQSCAHLRVFKSEFRNRKY